MIDKRWLILAAIPLMAACCPGGGSGGVKPPDGQIEVPPDDLSDPLVIRYVSRLQNLLQNPRTVTNSFQIAETCMTLFLIDGPKLFEKLADDQKEKLKAASALLKEPTGRPLLKAALENFYRVFILSEAGDAMLKAASLRMLMRILDDMADDASIRTLETGNGTDFRAALLTCTYRYASAALALRYEDLTKTTGRALARAGAAADALLRLSDFPSMKDEFKAHLRTLSDEIRSKPSSCFAIPADARGEVLIREGVNSQNAAVRETTSGGHPLVIYGSYQQSLVYLVLTGEVVDAVEREKFSGNLKGIPLILAQLEKMMLKGQ